MNVLSYPLDKQATTSLDLFPWGVCIFLADEKLSLIYANPMFHKTLEYSEEEMKTKFGNCLSALLPVEVTHLLLDCAHHAPTSFDMEISIRGKKHHNICLRAVFNFNKETHQKMITMVFFDTTHYKSYEEQLDHLRQNVTQAFKEANADVFEYNDTNGVISASTMHLFFAQPYANAVAPQFFIETQHIDESDCAMFLECFNSIANGEDTASCEVRIRTKEKNLKWAKLTLYRSHDQNEHLILGVLIDITTEKESTIKYLQETMYYQTMLSDQDAYGHIDISKDQFIRVGGLWNLYNEIVPKVTYTELYNRFIDIVVHPDDRAHYKETMQKANLIESFTNGIKHLGCDFRRIVEQNKMVWMRLYIHLFKDPISQHIMALMYIKNIDVEKKELLELKAKNDKDFLTGVYSRKTIDALIEESLNYRDNESTSYLVLINIDGFSLINRNQGYINGDQILQQIAKKVTSIFYDQDLIGRYGGSEFLLLVNHFHSFEEIQQRLNNLQSQLDQDFSIPVTFCAGVIEASPSEPYSSCLENAKEALEEAKKAGISQFIFHRSQYVATSSTQSNMGHLAITDNEKTNVNFNNLLGEEGEIAYLVDPKTFILLEGNDALYNRLGKNKAECDGKKCYELLHNRKTICPFCRKENWTSDKYYMYRNYNHVLEQEFMIKNKLVESNGKSVLLALAIDLSNNKSIVDSLENDTTENNCILNGIKNMQSAETLNELYQSAMEAICVFFRSDAVHLWTYETNDNKYNYDSSWYPKNERQLYTLQQQKSIMRWLGSKRWNTPIQIEGHEMMLCESFELYQIMIECQYANQLWFPLTNDNDEIYGIFEIDNININFQNTSFMESFSGFISNEKNKREMFKDIFYRNYHDDLTRLLNRNSYDTFIKKFDEEKVKSVAVISANINGLSLINTEQGINYGDYVLIQFAKLLTETFTNAFVFRLNGDEFIIITTDIPPTTIDQLLKTLNKSVEQDGSFTFTSGYAWDDIEKNLSKLIEIATQSMQSHKERYYDNLDKNRNNHHYKALNQLVEAIENKEFEVYFQAKIDTKKNKMFGAEALIRYIHKDFGIIPPVKFIPTLEENNLIRYIDLFVMEEVCRTLKKWQENHLECPIISLNFSRKTIHEDNLIDIMNQLTDKYGVDKKYIEIEITESHADVGKTILYQTVKQIRNAGFAVSLDDFGTNYTNLSILSDLDFDTLKIDRSLIHSIVKEEKNRIILKKVIEMCNDLDVEVIAEGVDSIEQQNILNQLGCTLIQGYLFSRPIPISEFEQEYMSIKE